MKYIITEEQNLRLSVFRRLSAVDEMINKNLSVFKGRNYLNVCDYDLEDFITVVIQWVAERMHYDFFWYINDDSEEWDESYNIIRKYIKTVHHKTISNFYSETCKQI